MPSIHHNPTKWITQVLLLSLLGCFGKPKPTPQVAPFTFEILTSAAPTLNRDSEGNPLSVVVRVFTLKDTVEFSKLTIEAAASNRSDTELLGADLLGKTELIIVPGSTQNVVIQPPPGARFIGLVAYFRKPDAHYWRYLVNLDTLKAPSKELNKNAKTKKNPSFTFRLEDCYMTLAGLKAEAIPGQPENAKPDCNPVQPALPKEEPKNTQSSVHKSTRKKNRKPH